MFCGSVSSWRSRSLFIGISRHRVGLGLSVHLWLYPLNKVLGCLCFDTAPLLYRLTICCLPRYSLFKVTCGCYRCGCQGSSGMYKVRRSAAAAAWAVVAQETSLMWKRQGGCAARINQGLLAFHVDWQDHHNTYLTARPRTSHAHVGTLSPCCSCAWLSNLPREPVCPSRSTGITQPWPTPRSQHPLRPGLRRRCLRMRTLLAHFRPRRTMRNFWAPKDQQRTCGQVRLRPVRPAQGCQLIRCRHRKAKRRLQRVR